MMMKATMLTSRVKVFVINFQAMYFYKLVENTFCLDVEFCTSGREMRLL